MTTAPPRGMAVCVLVLCFLMGLLGRGLPDSFAVYVVPLTKDFGWDRAEVVSIYSFYAAAGALSGPLIGRLFDRSGPAVIYFIGIALLCRFRPLAMAAPGNDRARCRHRRHLSRQYHQ
jgi:MFS family permease